MVIEVIDELTIYENIMNNGVKYLVSIFKNNSYQHTEIPLNDLIYNYYILLIFENINQDNSNVFNDSLNDFFLDNQLEMRFLNMIFGKMNIQKKKEWVFKLINNFDKIKLDFKNLIELSKYLYSTKILSKSLQSQNIDDLFKKIIYYLLTNSDCSSEDELESIHDFLIWFMKNISKELLINEFKNYISIGQIKNTYNYQINEYSKNDYNDDILLNNILLISLKIWERGLIHKDINNVQLEFLIDPFNGIELKDTIPIKKINDINFITDKDLILSHNKDKTIILPENYNLQTLSFAFIINTFNVTLNTYLTRSKIISKELIYWKEELINLLKIKEQLVIKSQEFDKSFNKKIKKIEIKIEYLTKKNKLFKKSIDDIILREKMSNFTNAFFKILNLNIREKIVLFHTIPENFISNLIVYCNLYLIKNNNEESIFDFCLMLIADKDLYPSLYTRCKFTTYCLRYSYEFIRKNDELEEAKKKKIYY